ncbi:MAG: glycoside hydrolase family 65 protein [Clostridia bacterium]|nr:glycoside hydrolase family 65 protein [Clostridia bacterium]
MRKFHHDRPLLFEPYEWQVVEKQYSEQSNKRNETVFALGNGYMGMRGSFEEGFWGNPENAAPATYINGIYEYKDYVYLWKRPGFPDRTHSILNVPDASGLSFYIDGEKVDMTPERVENYNRTLDMKRGLLSRSYRWTSKEGKIIDVCFKRFLSLDDIHVAAIRCEFMPLNFSGEIIIKSYIEGEVKGTNLGKAEIGKLDMPALFINDMGAGGGSAFFTHVTKKSGFTVATATSDKFMQRLLCNKTVEINEAYKSGHYYYFNVTKGETYSFDKFICYYTSRDTEKSNCKTYAYENAKKCAQIGFEKLLFNHTCKWEDFWEKADIIIKGDPEIQQAIRFDLFHLMQSTGKDGKTNISANGLTGDGYQGHTFWDTEMYIMPCFLYSNPEIVRNLLMYRYNILDKAKMRAKQMGGEGALYSWNSINGEECGFVFEAATAQYHINCDICYAIYKYVEATKDEEFLVNYGAEILFETSKFMAHRGCFIKYRGGKFCINVVCGPDEYTPAVDNNCYTNTLTRFQLNFALETAKLLKEKYPDIFCALCSKIGLDEAEFELWEKAANNMYIPYNEELGLLMQDDSFIYRDPLEIDAIPFDKIPLLNNLHPLNLWRFQVSKQADLVLLMFLRSQDYTIEMKKAVYDFYEPKTIHDSSLSASVHSIVANEIGYYDQAYNYFIQAARMDLDDYNLNTSNGIHAACMGGTWMAVVNGFAGMRVIEGMLNFKPHLPEKWERLEFKILFQGSLINASFTKSSALYTLISGNPIKILSSGEEIFLHEAGAEKRVYAEA